MIAEAFPILTWNLDEKISHQERFLSYVRQSIGVFRFETTSVNLVTEEQLRD